MPSPIFKIYPYRPKSAGARNLSIALSERTGYDVERISSGYVIQSNEWIINWGSGYFDARPTPGASNVRVFNSKKAVCLCINKIDFFKELKDRVNLPNWTLNKNIALAWAASGALVYCRENIEGKDGDGILVVSKKADVVDCPLYTQGVEADKEYRVHLFGHVPIFDLEKYHPDNDTKTQVRSGKMGWHYTRDTVVPEKAKQQAIEVSKCLKMDFVAVDLLYNTKTKKATVLEANTAPELGPWTRVAYAKCFTRLLKGE